MKLQKYFLKNYDKIKHHHKELIKKDRKYISRSISNDCQRYSRNGEKKIYMLGKLVKLLITLIIGFYVSIILLIYVGVPILNLILN